MDQIYQALSCLAVSLFFHVFGSSSISSIMLCSVKSKVNSTGLQIPLKFLSSHQVNLVVLHKCLPGPSKLHCMSSTECGWQLSYKSDDWKLMIVDHSHRPTCAMWQLSVLQQKWFSHFSSLLLKGPTKVNKCSNLSGLMRKYLKFEVIKAKTIWTICIRLNFIQSAKGNRKLTLSFWS